VSCKVSKKLGFYEKLGIFYFTHEKGSKHIKGEKREKKEQGNFWWVDRV